MMTTTRDEQNRPLGYGSMTLASPPSPAPAKRSLIVSLLFIIFGISAWIEVNGIWVEMPILVQTAPEGWFLASYIIVIAQLANLGPLLYSLIRKFFKGKKIEKVFIHLILATGTLLCLLLAFLWDRKAYIFGAPRSVALLSLAFGLAFVDCTSSVLYLPYLAYYREVYLMPLFIGEGMSGLIPSCIALIQGVGGNPECIETTKVFNETANITILEPYTPPPKFSVQIFFFLLTGLISLSWLAFFGLSFLPAAKKERVDKLPTVSSKTRLSESQAYEEITLPTSTAASFLRPLIPLLLMQAFINSLTNGVLPSIQTFSVLPYGNQAYHFAVTLSSMSNPIACFIAMYRPTTRLRYLCMFLATALVVASYILSTAVLSPIPPLVSLVEGKVLIVISWILFTGLMSYIKASLASVFRTKGHRALFCCGVMIQVGSAIGAVFSFFLVNYTSIFHSYSPCSS